jgi:hypothetical protein
VKRSRGRGRRGPPNNQSHSHGHNRPFDSAGPEIKIRGTAGNIYEKYLQLARDASLAGDRVAQENFLQHAEHYYRIMMANQTQYPQQQQQGGQQQQQQQGYQQQGQPQGNYQQQPNAGGQGGNAGEVRGSGAPTPQPYPQAQPVPESSPSFTLADDADETEESDTDEALTH